MYIALGGRYERRRLRQADGRKTPDSGLFPPDAALACQRKAFAIGIRIMRGPKGTTMRAAILLVAPLAFFVACGGSGGGTGVPAGPLDVNLTAAGVSPSSFSALSNADLRFTNNDTVDHQIGSS